MKQFSFLHILSLIAAACAAADSFRFLRPAPSESDEGDGEVFFDPTHGDKDEIFERGEQHPRTLGLVPEPIPSVERRPFCDSICRAKRRIKRCKRRSRDQEREWKYAQLGRASGDGDAGRRLRLHCEPWFFWQEMNLCPDYCLEASTMREGATLEIKECSRSRLQRFNETNGILRPAWSDSLCVESDKLKTCNATLQGFNDTTFELVHRGSCFSNPHHPKECEPVRFSECKEARNSYSNRWEWM